MAWEIRSEVHCCPAPGITERWKRLFAVLFVGTSLLAFGCPGSHFLCYVNTYGNTARLGETRICQPVEHKQDPGVANQLRPELYRSASKYQPLIVVIGASFVEGWNLSDIDLFLFINKGVSGETSSDMLARFRRDVLGSGAKYVIIWGFINDIHRADRRAIHTAVERAKANHKAMVDLARSNGITPILATELTMFGGKEHIEKIKTFLLEKIIKEESYRSYVNKHVLELNKWLQGYAKEEEVMVLDLHGALAGPNGIRREEFTTSDGTHISAEGYEELTRYTRQTLKDFIWKSLRK